MGIDMAIHDVIARLCYCHRAELNMQMHGRIGWQEGWWSTYQQDEVLTLAGVSPGSGVLHQEVKMDLQEAVFDKEAFREELRTQKLKVAKLEEQNLETSKIR